jgi:hypothetical protein
MQELTTALCWPRRPDRTIPPFAREFSKDDHGAPAKTTGLHQTMRLGRMLRHERLRDA